MSPRADTAARQRGATLVEAIVALALLALFSLLLLQGLTAARNLWQGASARASVAEAIEGAQAVLRERIGHMYLKARYDAPTPYPDIDGGPAGLVFTGPRAQADGPAGLARYQLAVEAGGDLVLLSRSDLFGRDGDRPWRRDVLLRGVAGLDIAYYGRTEDEAAAWRESWHKIPFIPGLIRLRVRFPSGDSRWWPDLLIRPMVNIDGDCVLYDEGARCAGRG
ncbi:prepilin-type N-terminal cleavage/methylation domain-containing protein [Zavarzinia aquatilis]|uniref:General secretion pathway protein GspJ n=1 Tax=Zavarzinia aquatilis TaxID=2211142 RepID=A0A317ECL1_9PROT|nr:prepilin-type N-terminal cleavage/methylation domain-containing protein [Zavarzinia aquatilis]PWR24639.1 hypothetical protein DKG74_07500 [Zavarzinia aquatilis]